MYLASRSCWRPSLSSIVFDLKLLIVFVNIYLLDYDNTKAEVMARIETKKTFYHFDGSIYYIMVRWSGKNKTARKISIETYKYWDRQYK